MDDLAFLKKHRDIFGKPRKGVHSLRIMDVAIVDYVGTIGIAFLLRYLTKVPIEICTIGAFILSILAHIVFGVDTATNKWLKKE